MNGSKQPNKSHPRFSTCPPQIYSSPDVLETSPKYEAPHLALILVDQKKRTHGSREIHLNKIRCKESYKKHKL